MNLDAHVVVHAAGPDGEAATTLARRAGATVDGDPPRPGSIVVVDEWTAENAPIVLAARAAGARVTVLAELLLLRAPQPVVAITGTAGKSTAARLLAAILAHAGLRPRITPAGRAGNAWPNHELISEDNGDWFVAELTSTHLCHMDAWPGPEVAVVTNLWPDHLELHGSFARYAAAKRRLLRRRDGHAVLNADDRDGRLALGPPATADVIEFSGHGPVARGVWTERGTLYARDGGDAHALGPADAMPAWAHPESTLAAAAAAIACGVPVDAIVPGLRSAVPTAHRFDDLGTVDGVRVIDDSLAATPRKVLAGIRRCPPGRLVMVAGGLAEVSGSAVHADPAEQPALDEACAAIDARAQVVVVFGPAGEGLRRRLSRPQVLTAHGLPTAVDVARAAAALGDTILIAPMFPVDQADRVDALQRLRPPRDPGGPVHG